MPEVLSSLKPAFLVVELARFQVLNDVLGKLDTIWLKVWLESGLLSET